MKTIIALGLSILMSSVIRGNEVCVKVNKQDRQYCFHFTHFDHPTDYGHFDLHTLEVQVQPNNDLTISRNSFEHMSIHDLRIAGFASDYTIQRRTSVLSLVEDSFAGMSKLETLVFSILDIGFNRENPLAPLGSLKELGMSWCNLTEAPTKMLASVPKLEYLYLDGNWIDAIRSDSFASLKILKFLDLSGSKITEIESGAFNGLSELVELRLRGNRFGNIPRGLFENLVSLRNLDLHGCSIRTITPGAFGGLILDGLDLSFNNIRVIETDTFNGLLVKVLSLDRNRIGKLTLSFPKCANSEGCNF